MAKYTQLSEDIIKNVGGKENIVSVAHCVTRLRFVLRDESKANDDVLKNMDGVVTVMKAGGQYQVVIGNHVPDVYNEVCKVAGISGEGTEDGEIAPAMSFKDKAFDLITGIMLPSISLLSASGIIKGLNTLFAVLGLYAQDSSYYIFINAIGDAMFYFFPVILGFNTAKKLKVNPFLGMLTGLILCYPTINGTDLTFFGFTMNATYTSSVLPAILIVALEKPIEKFFNKVIPDVVKTFITPLLTLMIAIPIGFIFIGPIANLIGAGLGAVINRIISLSPTIGGIIVGGLWQLLVIFGVHMVLVMPSITNLIAGTPDTFMALLTCASFAQTAVVFAIWLKTKDKKLKNIAFPAWISGIFGVTEPAIYGVTLPRIKMFVISCIGGALGGGIIGFFGVQAYTMAGMGIFMLPEFIDLNSGGFRDLYIVLIAIAISMVFSFILAFIIYHDDVEETVIEDENVSKSPRSQELLVSPIPGKIIPLSQVSDGAFAEGILGKGVAIEPTEGKVYAPANGTITSVFPTKHAIGITTDGGSEILIHIGMDTVRLDGQYFDMEVEQGQKVKRGDLLETFDMDAIQKAGYSLQTPVIVTNYTDYLDIIPMEMGVKPAGSELITLLV